MGRQCVLLLLLLLCGSLCAAHTPTALAKKAVKSVAKHTRQAAKAGCTAIKGGVKTAAGTAATGIKASKVAVEAASSKARR
jgi:hypothetical protein